MSCNCGPIARSELWTSIPKNTPTEMMPGEDVECYAKRTPDDEDKSGKPEIPHKIKNNAIVPDCNMNIDMQFEITSESTLESAGFKKPVVWSMVDPDDPEGKNGAYSISGVNFTTSGKMTTPNGFDPNLEGRKFNVMIIAKDSSNPQKIIDSRTYNFSPKKCTPGADLKFIHPLPGSICTSSFGPRNSPTKGASSFHKGLDFAYSGRKTADVLASCDGIVTKAGNGTGYGLVVYMKHVNGSGKLMAETRYAHLDSIYVKVGQQVSAGQPIGKEGNTGVGTGPHLHFELRLAGDNAVDPAPYLSGVKIASAAKKTNATDDNDVDPGVPAGQVTQQKNTNTAVTTSKVDSVASGCKQNVNTVDSYDDKKTDPTPPPSEPGDDKIIRSPGRASCAPTDKTQDMTVGEVKAKIQSVLNKHPELSEEDKEYLMKVAKIESGYDPYAKNKTSTATGLFQMLDKTADHYYKKMGVEPTCENRCDPEKATEAIIHFYKDGSLRYYKEFKTKQTLNGKKLSPDLIEKYNSLSKAEFCYGLIHHDGVGNAANGIDLQGVSYAKRKLA